MSKVIIELNTDVFWLSDENKIYKAKITGFSLDSNGGIYTIKLEDGGERQAYEEEVFKEEADIPEINFNNLFFLKPLLESNGLNGRGFPWSKEDYTYMIVSEIIRIDDFCPLDGDRKRFSIKIRNIGLISVSELKRNGIAPSKLKKDVPFFVDNIKHTKCVCDFNLKIGKLFKKITYNSINMNTTGCPLVGGGGFAYDSACKDIYHDSFIFIDEFIHLIEKSKVQVTYPLQTVIKQHKALKIDNYLLYTENSKFYVAISNIDKAPKKINKFKVSLKFKEEIKLINSDIVPTVLIYEVKFQESDLLKLLEKEIMKG